MAIQCPVCGKGTIKKGDKFIYCSEKDTVNEGGTFIEKGCLFKIFFNQEKRFGEKLTVEHCKTLLAGKTLVTKKGHKVKLDLENDSFLAVEYAPKEEDEDL